MTYTRKSPDVEAKRWTGDNLDEIQAFLAQYVGEDAALTLRNEKDSYVLSDGLSRSYNVLLFYAWGDDQEVDEGRWIVVELGADDGVGARHIYDDWEFNATFKKKANNAS